MLCDFLKLRPRPVPVKTIFPHVFESNTLLLKWHELMQ